MSELMPREKLNDNNYDDWSLKIKMHLMKENLWNVVSQPPPIMSYYGNWDEKNYKALGLIGLSLADNQLKHIKDIKNAYDCWIKLRENHEKSLTGQKIILLKKFLKMHLEYDQTMENHLNNMMDIIGKLLSYEDKYSEHFFITKILSTLPYQYDNLIASFESVAETDLTIEYVNKSLLREYEKVEEMKNKKKAYTESQLKNKAKYELPKIKEQNFRNNKYNNNSAPPSYDTALRINKSRDTQSSSSFTLPKTVTKPGAAFPYTHGTPYEPKLCYFCNKPGHLIKDCKVVNDVKPRCSLCKSNDHEQKSCPRIMNIEKKNKKEQTCSIS